MRHIISIYREKTILSFIYSCLFFFFFVFFFVNRLNVDIIYPMIPKSKMSFPSRFCNIMLTVGYFINKMQWTSTFKRLFIYWCHHIDGLVFRAWMILMCIGTVCYILYTQLVHVRIGKKEIFFGFSFFFFAVSKKRYTKIYACIECIWFGCYMNKEQKKKIGKRMAYQVRFQRVCIVYTNLIPKILSSRWTKNVIWKSKVFCVRYKNIFILC